MHIEVLVEDASTETALTSLLPRILPPTATWQIHPHRGKRDLLRKLRGRLRGYREWLPQHWRIMVLVDEDRQDCRSLKHELEGAARDAGWLTGPAVAGDSPRLMIRIAVEELEAWFFGDVAAIRAGYPRVAARLGDQARYRDPDAIEGGTWEALERVLQDAGYHEGGLRKIETARVIATHMNPEVNRSRSFACFRDGLRRLALR